MQTRLPAKIDPWKMVTAGSRLRGALPLVTMSRLLPLLSAADGVVTVTVEAGVDEEGVSYVAGHVETRVAVTCQRCLGSLEMPLALDFRLGLVAGETRLAELPNRYDPLLVAEGQDISLAELVEDELLLALPLAPMHADPEQCQRLGEAPVGTYRTVVDQPHPFAALAKLMPARDSKN